MNWQALAAPFPANGIEWRLQTAGEKDGKIWAKCLAYVTNRAIMERLDEVVGPGNWKNEYAKAPEGGILCGISIKLDGEWVTKWDGAENTDIEAVKGGLSGAMKRAAVQWGIGRYLYDLEEGWANVNDKGAHSGKTKETAKGRNDGKYFKWDPPQLPKWALPEGQNEPPKAVAGATAQQKARIALLLMEREVKPNGRKQVETEVNGALTTERAAELIERLAALPVKKVEATNGAVS